MSFAASDISGGPSQSTRPDQYGGAGTGLQVGARSGKVADLDADSSPQRRESRYPVAKPRRLEPSCHERILRDELRRHAARETGSFAARASGYGRGDSRTGTDRAAGCADLAAAEKAKAVSERSDRADRRSVDPEYHRLKSHACCVKSRTLALAYGQSLASCACIAIKRA